MYEKISDYFEGAAAKYLSTVDADRSRSNQHEVGGLPSVGFKKFLGTPGKGDGEEFRFPALMVYMSDDDEPVIERDEVTWYDARRNKPHRSPEYRLYYKDNSVTELIKPGDLFLIAKRTDDSLLMVFTSRGSQCEYELRSLFDVQSESDSFTPALVRQATLFLPIRLLLEELGIQTSVEDDSQILEEMLRRFGGKFPTTAEMSVFSRSRVDRGSGMNPDALLLEWMDEEERLFRIYERHLVLETIQEEIIAKGADVDRFVSLSLTVHNRRKSRVGHAFENHLEQIFVENQIRYGRGSSRNTTENNSKPDFLFPGFDAYHDETFPRSNLRMLGAKTTCKDRWRQVLAEANLISKKHLVTLQPGISQTQMNEMSANNLQLVVPEPLHGAYQPAQREGIITLADFIAELKSLG